MCNITKQCDGCSFIRMRDKKCKRYANPSAFIRERAEGTLFMCPSSKLNTEINTTTNKKRIGQQKQKRRAW